MYRSIQVSDWVIAVTIVAAGTSTPEFATSLTAAIKGRHRNHGQRPHEVVYSTYLEFASSNTLINPSNISEDIFGRWSYWFSMVGLFLTQSEQNGKWTDEG